MAVKPSGDGFNMASRCDRMANGRVTMDLNVNTWDAAAGES
jgi:hypothetical protein